jgi:hypothetical protein
VTPTAAQTTTPTPTVTPTITTTTAVTATVTVTPTATQPPGQASSVVRYTNDRSGSLVKSEVDGVITYYFAPSLSSRFKLLSSPSSHSAGLQRPEHEFQPRRAESQQERCAAAHPTESAFSIFLTPLPFTHTDNMIQ